MLFSKLPRLTIGRIKAKIPIIQGGMGVGISLANLASAVANCGGIGVISATGIGLLHPDASRNYRKVNLIALQDEIRKARLKTKGILGVNILIAASDFAELAMTALKESIDLIFLGAGLPLKKPDTLSRTNWIKILQKTVPIISSARAVRLICKHWQKQYGFIPDAFVVEGPQAGGHLGFRKEQIDLPHFQLENILTEVISAIKPFETESKKPISIITAGGIYSGSDIFRHIQLGAQGVQMATRFIATQECDASLSFKEAFLQCKKEDLVLIDSPVGLPGRAIQNSFLHNVSQGNLNPIKCSWKCLRTCDYKKAPYCIAQALQNAQGGHLNRGFAFAGTNAYRLEKITTVKELIDSLTKEYAQELVYFRKKKKSVKRPRRLSNRYVTQTPVV
ncbi:nitronate monooxygenase [bacterium]|nr:nitronate monooxygenase [bacterium]